MLHLQCTGGVLDLRILPSPMPAGHSEWTFTMGETAGKVLRPLITPGTAGPAVAGRDWRASSSTGH